MIRLQRDSKLSRHREQPAGRSLSVAHRGAREAQARPGSDELLTRPWRQRSRAPALRVFSIGNCSHCRTSTVDGEQFSTPYSLRVLVAAQTVEDTATWQTAVNVPTAEFMHAGITDRITAGDPSSSCVAYRMGQRGNDDQMPPFGSKVVDQTGLATVTAWIQSRLTAVISLSRRKPVLERRSVKRTGTELVDRKHDSCFNHRRLDAERVDQRDDPAGCSMLSQAAGRPRPGVAAAERAASGRA